jgi:hypothetical protein
MRLEAQVARELWSRELALVGKMLTRDSRNFHGWGYRRTVVSELESAKLNGTSMVEPEFEYTTKMIKVNLSNFSAWHYRSKLIPRLLNERNASGDARRQFLDDGAYQSLYRTMFLLTYSIIKQNLTLSPRLYTQMRILMLNQYGSTTNSS